MMQLKPMDMKVSLICAAIVIGLTSLAQSDSHQLHGGAQAMELSEQVPRHKLVTIPSRNRVVTERAALPIPAIGIRADVSGDKSSRRILRKAMDVTTGRLSTHKSGNWLLYMAILLGLIGLFVLVVALDLMSLGTAAIIFNLLVFLLLILYLLGYV